MNPYAISAVYGQVMESLDDAAWQDAALCAQTDPEAFFPEKGGSTREAKRTCRACPVRAECLEYALEHGERFGIYGGMTERERRNLKRQFGDDTAAATASVIMPPGSSPKVAA